MSLYQVQQCVYNYLRTLEAVEAGSPVPELSTSGYDLTKKKNAPSSQATSARCIRWASTR